MARATPNGARSNGPTRQRRATQVAAAALSFMGDAIGKIYQVCPTRSIASSIRCRLGRLRQADRWMFPVHGLDNGLFTSVATDAFSFSRDDVWAVWNLGGIARRAP